MSILYYNRGMKTTRKNILVKALLVFVLVLLLANIFSPVLAQDHEEEHEDIGEELNEQITAGIEIFTIVTLALLVQVLLITAFSMHIGRPYFIRILKKYTLRLGADIWWTMYIVIRDGSLFFSFLLGFMYFYPHVLTEVKFAVPWYPFSMGFIAATLSHKLREDTDEEGQHYKLTTALVTIATILHTAGTVFVVQAPHGTLFDWTEDHGAWEVLQSMFRSDLNFSMAAISFWVTLTLLTIILVVVIVYFFTGEEKGEQ